MVFSKLTPFLLSCLVLFGASAPLAGAGDNTLVQFQTAHGSGSVLVPEEGHVQNVSVLSLDSVVAVRWQDKLPSGELRNGYRLSLDGGKTFSRARYTGYELKTSLRGV